MLNPAVRFAARLFYITAIASAILLSSFFSFAHAQQGGVDRDKNEVVIEGRPTADQALTRFTTNVTEMAKSGKLRPFIGERTKIRELLEVMSKAGNKVVYVLGEAGSGKTALAEQAAAMLEGKTVYSLNLGNLEAGTGYRGMLEDRVEALLEAFMNRPDRILMIDEAHQVMRMPDFMNRLKPPMGRGELNLIMLTTEDEYRDHVEHDVALTSRGNVTKVAKPDFKKMMTVLRANKDAIASKHGIPITDAALEMTAKLVMRHYAYEPLLRKALDIIDRAAARTILNQKYGSYDKLHLEDAKEALELTIKSLEGDLKHQPQNGEIAERLDESRNELTVINEKLAKENKDADIGKLNADIADLRKKMAEFQKAGQLDKAAEVQYRQIPFIEQKIREAGAQPETSAMITDKHIAKFVSTETGIPASFLAASDVQRLADLSKFINSRVAAQGHATEILISKLKIRQANVEALSGPQMIILVDGPTGVGKSEWTRALTMGIYGDHRHLLQIALNSYTEGNASRLIGSEPGIVDSSKGGELDALRRNPTLVVGYDEFDKAPQSVRNILLQGWSEGEMKDGRGRPIDFRHSIQVVQANFTEEYAVYRNVWTHEQIEARFMMPPGSLAGLTQAEIDEAVVDRAMELKGVPPAVRNRMIKVVFNAITFEQAIEIAYMKLIDQANYIWKEKRVNIRFDRSVAEAVAAAGFDAEYGVRPLQRKQSEVVSDLLADLDLDSKRGQTIELHFVKDADGKGGTLRAIDAARSAELKAKTVVFKTLKDPKAAAARVQGEAGQQKDPTDRRNIVDRAAERARKK